MLFSAMTLRAAMSVAPHCSRTCSKHSRLRQQCDSRNRACLIVMTIVTGFLRKQRKENIEKGLQVLSCRDTAAGAHVCVGWK